MGVLGFKTYIHLLSSLLLVLFLSVNQANAQTNSLRQEFELKDTNPYPNRKYFGEVIFTTMGRRTDDPFVQSRYARAIIEGTLGVKYENWLEAKLAVVQLLTSGTASQQMGVTEAGPGSGFFMDEASISLKPADWLKGSFGVLAIKFSPIYSLYSSQSEAGGQVELSQTWGDKDELYFKTSLKGSQSIPTAKSNGNLITDEGTSPLLTVGTAYAEVDNKLTGTRARISATHFEFTDLPGSAASDSLKIGGSVFGTKDIQFLYEFRGKEFAAALKQEIGLSHAVEVKASTIRNERAPAGLNEGNQVKVEYTRAFNKWELLPSYTQFRVEGDALPALYSISSIGYTNRIGYALALKANFPKENFNVFGGYTNSKAIREAGIIQTNTNTSTYQADREIYTLGAEVQYDIF